MEWRPCWTCLERHCLHNLWGLGDGFFSPFSFGGRSRDRCLLSRASLSWTMVFKIARSSRGSSYCVCGFSMVLCECYFCAHPLSRCLVLQAALSASCPNRALFPGTVKEMARKQASQVRQLRDANLNYISLRWPRWKTTVRCLKFSLAQNPGLPRI